jgi:hypothetical protein
MTTPELLRAIGEALFGVRWQKDLSDELGINRRTMQRWLVGHNEPSPGVWAELEAVLSERASAAMRLCDALRAKRAQTDTVASEEIWLPSIGRK